ncbi:MAG: hypothetical protein F6K47_24105 [Symploca sp. SIO2E6]|nr:hypothetical protein [Symploca sp. SIO2E6]
MRASCSRLTTSCLLYPALQPTTSCLLSPAYYLLPTTSCLLPLLPCSLLPPAYYLLPPASCLGAFNFFFTQLSNSCL